MHLAARGMRAVFGGRMSHGWIAALFAVVFSGMLIAGLRLRDWVYDVTEPVRFVGDIDNGFNWGQRAHREGYFDLFERTHDNELDYGPLRLGFMTLWSYWLEAHQQMAGGWQPSPTFNAFPLGCNTVMELIAANGALLVVQYWRRLTTDRTRLRWWTGLPSGLAAFAAYWFNPAIVWNAHAWPQWDTWLVTGFIWAIYFAGHRWWMTAGFILGLTGLFKGQILFVLPAFLLWPLVRGDWRGLLRVPIGFATCTGLIGVVWETTALGTPDDPHLRHVVWPTVIWVSVCLLSFLLLQRRRRLAWEWGLVVIGISLLTCMPMFGSSTRWLECAYLVGKDHYPVVALGENCNLAALLAYRFGFDNGQLHQVVFTMRPGSLGGWMTGAIDVTLRQLLVGLFLLLSIVCGIFAGIHDRRRDPRFLLAIVTPWLVFFAFLPQMHERYLVFFAGAGALLVGVGMEVTLLAMAMSLLALLNMARDMIGDIDPQAAAQSWQYWVFRQMRLFINGAFPDIGWALLVVTLLLLWKICCFSRQSRPVDASDVALLAACSSPAPGNPVGDVDGNSETPVTPAADLATASLEVSC